MPGEEMIIPLAQAAFGIIQTATSAAKVKRLMGQRKAYVTPSEYYNILNATKNRAQQGYDPFTLDYLTNQTDRAFSSSLETARRLGADPNDLSSLFDQKMQSVMKIGAENHALNLENFSKYLSALDVIGQNKTAEWKSQQDIIKDKLQAAAGNQNQGVQNIQNAINSFLSMWSADQMGNLYQPQAGRSSTNRTSPSGSDSSTIRRN